MNESWMLGPFTKLDASNPVLEPYPHSRWECSFAGEVAWEEKDVFNPAAIVRDGKVHLLYRAEDTVGRHMGTSRIGLAVSDDGVKFHREPSPVLFPADDINIQYELEGGCEDPRVVSTPEGGYVITYTAYDGVKARLCVATSPDLRRWEKHGLAFPHMPGLWCKAGAIVCVAEGDQMTAVRLHGKYWMYWGESYIFAATSDDLVHWEPVVHPKLVVPKLMPGMPHAPDINSRWLPHEIGIEASDRDAFATVIRPRPGRFDSALVEPGPPAILTDDGIVLMYHGKNSATVGDPTYPPSTYSVGQLLLDPSDPTSVLSRPIAPFLVPDKPYELTGQVGNVCFAEGLVRFKDSWLLYYGTADSKIAVASAPAA